MTVSKKGLRKEWRELEERTSMHREKGVKSRAKEGKRGNKESRT